MTTIWERLRLSNDEKIPPLLYKFISTAYTYEIYITDLTNVWAEQLSRQAILRRASEENTTIDPSEDAEQFGVLLQKIRDALHGEAGSSATLNHQSRGDSLELITYTELPAPLEPLKWTLCLSKEPPSASTSQLLLPLVMAEADWESRQRALIEQLYKKDWVLGKLFDKIEAMGIDLGTIFPGTSGLRTGRKGTTLSQAARYIKGVAPFDEQVWFDEVNKSSPHLGFAANIVKAFTGASSTGSFEGLDPPPDAWWEQVGTHDSPLAVPSTRKEHDQDAETKDVQKDDATETNAGTETEDEFERQETPPRLKRSREAGRKPSDSTDEEETDEDTKEPAKPPPQPKKAAKGLGVIGGRKPPKPASPEPSTQPPATTKTNKPSHPSSDATHSDDETDSASDLDAPPTRRQPPKPKSPETKTHPKTGLGVIGGRKKETQKPSSPAAQKSPSKTTAQHSKLGVIGGRASRSAEPRSPSTHHHHHTPSQSPSPPPPSQTTKSKPKTKPSLSPKKNQPQDPPKAEPEPEPETEQEKADRKREELKRQLEMKSKAPTKKKRRF
ncbi:uncharacterized protein BDW47DRAFT_130224 [Aspergillus candidus]|uniref:Non-homologous end-joining factor 1 n=1 Tax=Aspergillus candidus TaxID=41067 RepID=A0A2I2EXK8_ASPCN|nr:XLF-domain-containing protein [Aspergillus candidus]PLB33113.1 XLF-domain-containing protein [Aspergillus candidus]